MTINVLLLSRYTRTGASSRLRSYQYLPFLETEGIQVDVAPLFGDSYLNHLYTHHKKNILTILGSYLNRLRQVARIRRYKLIWIEKELLPWLPGWTEAFITQMGIPYVVDYDDADFHRYDLHPSPAIRTVLGRKIDGIMKNATLVIAGNDYLAERAERAGACKIRVLPTVIDLDRYPLKSAEKGTGFRIGWIGSPTTADYLFSIQAILAKLGRLTNVKLILVGTGSLALDGIQVETRDWSESTEVNDILDFDVGIMPMPDEPWTKGKCGYKLIQYMGTGCPVVASPVGANKVIVANGENGFLPDSPEAWETQLKLLLENGELRTRLGQNGRRVVEKKYCLQVTAPILSSLLASAATD